MHSSHVLVVEDDPLLRDTLTWALEDDGFQVAVAIDGEDAVDQFNARPPRLVVLDMSLPRLDGYGVAAELRARFGAAVPPILVITADGQARQKQSVLKPTPFCTSRSMSTRWSNECVRGWQAHKHDANDIAARTNLG